MLVFNNDNLIIILKNKTKKKTDKMETTAQYVLVRR